MERAQVTSLPRLAAAALHVDEGNVKGRPTGAGKASASVVV